jgi:hypothetical protein
MVLMGLKRSPKGAISMKGFIAASNSSGVVLSSL